MSDNNKRTTSPATTLDILQALSPFSQDESHDMVTKASRELLLSCVRTDLRVHTVFFPAAETDPLQGRLDLRTFPMEHLSVALVAEAIANVKDEFGFHSTINKGAVDDALRDIYGSLQWKKLGFQMYTLVYPEVVRDPDSGLSLKDYMGDEGYVWAERLVAAMQEPGWTQRVHQRIVRGQYSEDDYNRDMNAIFVKLHILDPQSVIPAYQFLLSQRALPAVNLELATRNYLGGALDWRSVQHDVETAQAKVTAPLHMSRHSSSSSSGARQQQQHHHQQHTSMEVFYGSSVDDFIVSECRNLGLWSGLRPDNVRVAPKSDRCRVM